MLMAVMRGGALPAGWLARHLVKVQDFENSLNRGCKSPRETAMKAGLKQILGIHRQQ
jgi:hypothetical protein